MLTFLTERRKQLTCKQCGKRFIAYMSSKRKFCSRACADKHHAIHLNNGVFKKGCRSYIRTDEHRKKLSNSLKGRKCPWNIERNKKMNLKGDKNPNYKHGLTHDNKCVDCGKRIWITFARCKSCANKGKNNPRYIDGRTLFERGIRNLFEYKLWRKKVLQRDKGVCQKCGSGNDIEVHHVVSFFSICDEFISWCKQMNWSEDDMSEAVKWYHPLWDVDNGI